MGTLTCGSLESLVVSHCTTVDCITGEVNFQSKCFHDALVAVKRDFMDKA